MFQNLVSPLLKFEHFGSVNLGHDFVNQKLVVQITASDLGGHAGQETQAAGYDTNDPDGYFVMKNHRGHGKNEKTQVDFQGQGD